MTVNRLSDNRVLIILCGKDMEEFSLKYDTMDLEDLHSRKILMRLMQVACRKSGIPGQKMCGKGARSLITRLRPGTLDSSLYGPLS